MGKLCNSIFMERILHKYLCTKRSFENGNEMEKRVVDFKALYDESAAKDSLAPESRKLIKTAQSAVAC
jgi:hypothetical protein